MSELSLILLTSFIFFVAGGVKGVVGLGLPTISLGLFVIFLDLSSAMALILIPSIITNAWQAFAGKHTKEILKTIWVYLLFAAISVWSGVKVYSAFDNFYLSLLLGVLIILYSGTSIMGFSLNMTETHKKWFSPLLGVLNGILTGMTGSFMVPGVMYLKALNLTRDKLIQAMGMLFLVSTVSLTLSLQRFSLLSAELFSLSLYGIIPTLVGMVAGRQIRRFLSEKLFHQFFFISILVLGISIILKSAFIT